MQRAAALTEGLDRAPRRRWIALLGRREVPTDGVGDYCTYLGQALAQRGIELEQVYLHWLEKGWFRALRELWCESAHWSNDWVLLQYTAMAWSRRGFPFGVLAAMAALRWRGLRCAVIFHESFAMPGSRLIGRIRRTCQSRVIRRLYEDATKAVFADPLGRIEWIQPNASKAVFLPIGANIPDRSAKPTRDVERNGEPATVVVFCVSDPPHLRQELDDISKAATIARQNGASFRLVFFGRGTAEAKAEIEQAFKGLAETRCLGLLNPEQLAEVLEQADAMLCVRGPLYVRRGSAIAGLAHGLAIVGYEGEAEGTPLEDAGVVLVPYRDGVALGTALGQVLKDKKTLGRLREESRRAYETHFAWNLLALRLTDFLGVPQP